MQYLFGILMFLTSVFLILLVLVQRGRGGGLAGAFGGMGGQSAFGAKAGDLFTRITIGVAGFWIGLCVLGIWVLNQQEVSKFGATGGTTLQAVSDEEVPANTAVPSNTTVPSDSGSAGLLGGATVDPADAPDVNSEPSASGTATETETQSDSSDK